MNGLSKRLETANDVVWDARPLPLSRSSHAPSSLFCQPVPLTPSVSPRRSLSLSLPRSHPPPSPPPPSVTLTPFVRSYLWQSWWCHRREECLVVGGLTGVQSAVSSACVCTSGQCGNAPERGKKSQTQPSRASECVCPTARTHVMWEHQ